MFSVVKLHIIFFIKICYGNVGRHYSLFLFLYLDIVGPKNLPPQTSNDIKKCFEFIVYNLTLSHAFCRWNSDFDATDNPFSRDNRDVGDAASPTTYSSSDAENCFSLSDTAMASGCRHSLACDPKEVKQTLST